MQIILSLSPSEGIITSPYINQSIEPTGLISGIPSLPTSYRPSDSPTLSSGPSEIPKSCTGTEIVVMVFTGGYGNETYWDIKDLYGNFLGSMGELPYSNNQSLYHSLPYEQHMQSAALLYIVKTNSGNLAGRGI